jgi:hypothetical protein
MNTSDVFQATQYGAILFTHDPTSVIVTQNSTNQTYSEAVTANCQLNSAFVNYTNPSDCVDRYGGLGYVIVSELTNEILFLSQKMFSNPFFTVVTAI